MRGETVVVKALLNKGEADINAVNTDGKQRWTLLTQRESKIYCAQTVPRLQLSSAESNSDEHCQRMTECIVSGVWVA
jgi:hypothetical protein